MTTMYSSSGKRGDESSSLERANFDLKMQIFYLNQKVAALEKSVVSGEDGANTVTGILESRFVDITALREENSIAQKKISDLEDEVLLLRLSTLDSSKKSAGNASNEKLGNGNVKEENSVMNSVQLSLDENRKRERQAAQAIAEHDAAVIEKLEKDLQTLQETREADLKEFGVALDRAEKLHMEGIDKDKIISSQKDEIVKLNSLVSYFKSKTASLTPALTPLSRINSKNANMDDNFSGIGDDGDDETKKVSLSVSLPPSSPPPPPPPPLLPTLPMSSTKTPSKTMSSKDFLDFRAQAAWEELHSLRAENANLKEQLERERTLMKNQEFALQKVKSTAEEITLLEAEEIARLEAELERCIEDRDKWSRNCKTAESKAKTLRQRLMDMEKNRREEYRLQEDVENAFVNLSSMVAKGPQGNGYGQPSTRSLQSIQSTPYRLLSPTSTSRSDFLNSPTFNKVQMQSAKQQQGALVEHQRAIEMYKQREAELLNTLERVCMELEIKTTITER